MSLGSKKITRLFFDITSLISYIEQVPRYSGIQRVVTSLLVSIWQTPEVDRCFLSFIDRKAGVTKYIPLRDLPPEILLSPARMREIFFRQPFMRNDIHFLSRYNKRPVKYLFHRTKLDIAMLMGRDRQFERYNMTAAQWKKIRFGELEVFDRTTFSPKAVDTLMEPGDHLVLLDSSWLDWQIQGFASLRKAGLVVTTLVYDLIPIVQPSAVASGMHAVFHDWLLKSAGYTDTYMAISKSVQADLVQFLQVYEKTNGVAVLPLTQCALATARPQENTLSASQLCVDRAHYGELIDAMQLDERLVALKQWPYVLCVGTIEIRKNGWRLAMAWKKLIDEGHADIPRLIFAGRRGWGCDNLFDLLGSSGNIYGYVTVLEGPSDEELDFLYRNCSFAAMPSCYEGWGLPVGEALSYGKTAVVSNSSSLPEVGLDLVEYCDPQSIASIAAAVLRLVEQRGRRVELEAKIAVSKLRNWQDVAQDLFRIIED